MTLIAWILVVFVAELGIFALCACVFGARREREARRMEKSKESEAA